MGQAAYLSSRLVASVGLCSSVLPSGGGICLGFQGLPIVSHAAQLQQGSCFHALLRRCVHAALQPVCSPVLLSVHGVHASSATAQHQYSRRAALCRFICLGRADSILSAHVGGGPALAAQLGMLCHHTHRQMISRCICLVPSTGLPVCMYACVPHRSTQLSS